MNLTKTQKSLILLIPALIFAVILFIRFGPGGNDQGITLDNERAVQLASVLDLNTKKSDLPLIGTVRSVSEVSLRPEVSGTVSDVYLKAGDDVSAGTVIAEVENSTQRAAVLQAEGIYEAALSQLEKIQNGLRAEERDIVNFQLGSAQGNYEETVLSAVNALESAFTLVDDAIRNKADILFLASRTSSPKVTIGTDDIFETQNLRASVELDLLRWANVLDSGDARSNIESNLNFADETLRDSKKLLDDLSDALTSNNANAFSSAQISTWRASILGARTNINSALSIVSGAKTQLINQESALGISEKQYEQAISGARSEDIRSASASVKQAQGALAIAQSNLEKTLLRTPISGEITLMTASVGDFVNAFDQLVTVSNEGALEIITYITEDDVELIKVGAEALVDDRYLGVVTQVGKSLDEKTKKIEVRIGLIDGAISLISGQSVDVDIERYLSLGEELERFIVPISSLKIGAEGSFVFTLDEDNSIVSNKVEEGSIVGENIFIEKGITSDMNIVLDARGLKTGDVVTVLEE